MITPETNLSSDFDIEDGYACCHRAESTKSEALASLRNQADPIQAPQH